MKRDWPLLIVVLIAGAAFAALIFCVGRDKGQSEVGAELTQSGFTNWSLKKPAVTPDGEGPKLGWQFVKALLPFGKA